MARQTPVRPVNQAIARQRAHLARELVETLLLVGLIFVIVHFTIQTFSASGDTGMGKALLPNQLVLVNTKAYIFGGPGRGDVVVLTTDPSNPKATIARRVIGIPRRYGLYLRHRDHRQRRHAARVIYRYPRWIRAE